MKKEFLFVLFLFAGIVQSYSQNSFEEGYFIDTANQKTICLIKNMDWQNNPVRFDYKLSQDAEVQSAYVLAVKEFGINGASKFISIKVNIDRSGSDAEPINANKNPVFKEEHLFLKALIEGKASLYSYESRGLSRFFLKTDTSKLEQLVNKRYLLGADNVFINDQFKQQLLASLTCENVTFNDVRYISYNKKEIGQLVASYNECVHSGYVNYSTQQKRDLFNVSLRPGINLSALGLHNAYSQWDTSFDKEVGFRLGIETELFLPFSNNHWSFIAEPTYRYFEAEKHAVTYFASGQTRMARIKYTSIELPVGFRGRVSIGNKSQVFANALLVFDFNSNSSIELIKFYQSTSTSESQTLEIKSRMNAGLGIGYTYANRYSMEMRYQTKRDILRDYQIWSSDYKSVSVILGYTLF